METEQLINQRNIEHQKRLNIIIQTAEYNLFSILKPKLYRDGNQWCCLYGEDIQEGICGFGESPYKAIMDWNNSFFKSIYGVPN